MTIHAELGHPDAAASPSVWVSADLSPLMHCLQLAGMFKTTPGLGIFSYQALTHMFEEGADGVYNQVVSRRSSMMAFWVDKLPVKLVEALAAAVQLVRVVLAGGIASAEGVVTRDRVRWQPVASASKILIIS
jgi:hypothetical protein